MIKGPRAEPDAARFRDIAEAAFKALPEEFRRFVEGVVFQIEEFPDDEIMDEMEIDDPYDLLGLYDGVALDEKSVSAVTQDLDRVFLYRKPILDYCRETGETPEWVVRHVIIHEIGHHFGLSDDDMERIELAAEENVEDHR
jgi:predicted Zn-dependent protease with MMP-like domain